LLKKRAAAEGNTVEEIVLRGVELVLAEQKPKRKRRKLPLIKSKRPGIIDLDNERIYDLIGFP
jgi:hypothetical protein